MNPNPTETKDDKKVEKFYDDQGNEISKSKYKDLKKAEEKKKKEDEKAKLKEAQKKDQPAAKKKKAEEEELDPTKYLENRKKWIEEGLDCEILKLGESSWKKGKVRVKMTIEFCPDEPELPVYQSPLDEIYREIQGLQ